MKTAPNDLRHADVSEIIELLRVQPNLSRAELGQNLGRTPATVTNLVRGLIDVGIVEEVDQHNSFNGRPRIPLRLNANAMYAVTADIGISSVSIALFNFSGEIVYLLEIPKSLSNVTEGVGIIADGIQHVLSKTGIGKEKICGLGMSIPGIFNATKGTVIFSPNFPEWTGMGLKEIFRKETGFETIIIENDANASALGELWFGTGRKLKDFICVLADTGIGAGFIHDRQLVRGEDNATGEIGHMLVDTEVNAPLCGCGNHGCLEAVASRSIVNKKIQSGESPSEVMEQTSSYLGIAFSNLINTFSPQAIILLGPTVSDYPEMFALIVQKTRIRMLPYLLNRVLFLPSALGHLAPLYGLAGLLFSDVLTNGSNWLVRSSPCPT